MEPPIAERLARTEHGSSDEGQRLSEQDRAVAPATPDADFERLRQLLLGGTADAVERLRQRLDDPAVMTEEISRVLPAAIRRRSTDDDQLATALSPIIADALQTQVRKNPQLVIDVVFPVLGPAIRKWIARSLEELAETINRAVEHTFSVQGMRWRLEAKRTGRPFAEVLLAHSLVYRVEQVLLVHRDTGLLLHHCLLRDPVARNPDVVSSMLTAIRDFVRDSFHSADSADLHEFRVGALTVVVEEGPRAALTAVVRGKPPPELRHVMQEVVEQVHGELGSALTGFKGDTDPFASCDPLLERCMLEKQKPKEHSRVGGLVLVGVALTLVSLLVVWWLHARTTAQRWSELVAALRAEPGIVVTNHDRSGTDHHLIGLRDPLARAPAAVITAQGFDPATLRAVWTEVALPEMALARAQAILLPPSTVDLQRRGSILHARGQAHSSWVRRGRELVALIPGVNALVIDALELTDAAVFTAAIAEVQAKQLDRADDDLGTIESIDGFAKLLAAIDHLDLVAHEGGLGARVVVLVSVLSTERDRTLGPGRLCAEAVRGALARHTWRCTQVTAEVREVDGVAERGAKAPQLISFSAAIDKDPGIVR